MADLPAPDSDELRRLVPTQLHREIYRVVYERRDDPPTMPEIQAAVRASLGDAAADQVHFSKRVRELRDSFVMPTVQVGGRYTYHLVAVDPKPDAKISGRLRAKILRHQRCAQCGKTPTDDGVRLHVDHKVPREWGGPSEEWNLQALCSDCNEGKKDYYATFEEFADEIALSIGHDSVHVRIGELLKAFAANGSTTPDELLETVAEARGRQRYWEKRMRELRHLGWKFTALMHNDEDGIRRTEWELLNWEPWPGGSVSAEIKRRASKKQAGQPPPAPRLPDLRTRRRRPRPRNPRI